MWRMAVLKRVCTSRSWSVCLSSKKPSKILYISISPTARGGKIYTLPKMLKPPQVKQAMTGYGRAEKQQVEKLVALELGWKEKIRPDDAADALAIALTAGFLR